MLHTIYGSAICWMVIYKNPTPSPGSRWGAYRMILKKYENEKDNK